MNQTEFDLMLSILTEIQKIRKLLENDNQSHQARLLSSTEEMKPFDSALVNEGSNPSGDSRKGLCKCGHKKKDHYVSCGDKDCKYLDGCSGTLPYDDSLGYDINCPCEKFELEEEK